jgi:hypothetical protein
MSERIPLDVAISSELDAGSSRGRKRMTRRSMMLSRRPSPLTWRPRRFRPEARQHFDASLSQFGDLYTKLSR